MPKLPRVFLAPLDISGYYACLTRGLRDIGCRAEFLSLGAHYGGWSLADSAAPIRLYHRAYHWFVESRKKSRYNPQRYGATLWLLLAQTVLIFWVALGFDIIVLKSGESLLASGKDVALYRSLGKTVIAIFHGSDSRPPYLVPDHDWITAEQLNGLVAATRARVDRVGAQVDYIVDNPLSAQFQSRPCCLYQLLGNVVDERKLAPGFAALEADDAESIEADVEGSVRILHAPSNAFLKGTDRIRSCIARLKKRGHRIDYVEISGRPNSEVMAELARCDFVIDELYSDIHGAILALEACGFGKPVVVGGYGQETLERFVPTEARVPTVFCHPDQLEDVVERLVVDAEYRHAVGEQSKAFFDSYAAPQSVARRLLRLAAGEVPSAWFFDPQDLTYVKGIGGEESRIRANIEKLVHAYGEAALRLDDKPALKARVLGFMRDKVMEKDAV